LINITVKELFMNYLIVHC